MEEAVTHCTKGIGIWDWASTDDGEEPDVVMACAGDIATMESLAAVAILKERFSGSEDPLRQRRRSLPAHAGDRTSAWTL